MTNPKRTTWVSTIPTKSRQVHPLFQNEVHLLKNINVTVVILNLIKIKLHAVQISLLRI